MRIGEKLMRFSWESLTIFIFSWESHEILMSTQENFCKGCQSMMFFLVFCWKIVFFFFFAFNPQSFQLAAFPVWAAPMVEHVLIRRMELVTYVNAQPSSLVTRAKAVSNLYGGLEYFRQNRSCVLLSQKRSNSHLSAHETCVTNYFCVLCVCSPPTRTT